MNELKRELISNLITSNSEEVVSNWLLDFDNKYSSPPFSKLEKSDSDRIVRYFKNDPNYDIMINHLCDRYIILYRRNEIKNILK